MSVEFGDLVVGHGAHPSLGDNGTVHMAYWETVDDDVVMLRMYADHDRDLVFFTLIDAMPTVGDQWKTPTGTGTATTRLDRYRTHARWMLSLPRSSSTVAMTTTPTDTETASMDAMTGRHLVDRPLRLRGLDQDGWSDNDASYFDGDVFKGNWKQALDTDGDGFGDNHGVDCCAVPVFDSPTPAGRPFPLPRDAVHGLGRRRLRRQRHGHRVRRFLPVRLR